MTRRRVGIVQVLIDGRVQVTHKWRRQRRVDMVLSTQQLRILAALEAAGEDGLERGQLHAVLFGVAAEQSDRARPLTATERASLSRSLRRLQEHGMVKLIEVDRLAATERAGPLLAYLCEEWGGEGEPLAEVLNTPTLR